MSGGSDALRGDQGLAAGAGGDVDQLLSMLSPEVVVLSDGGGVVHASMRAVRGPRAAGRFLANLASRFADDARVFTAEINGRPGVVFHGGGRWAAATMDVDEDGRVSAVYLVVNPAKLERLVATIPSAADLPGPADGAGRIRHWHGRAVGPGDPVRRA